MTDGGRRDARAETPTFEEGRYVYCLVSLEGTDGTSLETEGVEGEPVRVVDAGDVGAVVHDCEEIYDSADLERIRRWLVRHQRVVDDAGDAFGTPLPFQFDTVFRGDDAAVHAWLERERETLEAALSSLAGHWEYRVEVVRTDPVDESTLVRADADLTDLRGRIEDAPEGAAFLLEKRYERRLDEVRARRRGDRADRLRDRLADHAREVHELERTRPQSVGELSAAADDGAETVCRLTLLAHEAAEAAIGGVLDEVAEEDGLEVRFTGPWPPYTFAPSFGEGATGRDGGPEPTTGTDAR
nr:GvpL/GvpF family gas vesicle protein [Natronobiforma cellulositropha]